LSGCVHDCGKVINRHFLGSFSNNDGSSAYFSVRFHEIFETHDLGMPVASFSSMTIIFSILAIVHDLQNLFELILVFRTMTFDSNY